VFHLYRLLKNIPLTPCIWSNYHISPAITNLDFPEKFGQFPSKKLPEMGGLFNLAQRLSLSHEDQNLPTWTKKPPAHPSDRKGSTAAGCQHGVVTADR